MGVEVSPNSISSWMCSSDTGGSKLPAGGLEKI